MRRMALVCLLVATACTVRYPSGWEQRITPPQRIAATPWVLYGKAPRSWDLVSGERIRVEVVDASTSFGFGRLRSNYYYAVHYESTPGDPIVCMTSPSGPGVPPTGFGCWSTRPGALAFWLTVSAACDPTAMRTRTTPECWNGEGEAGGQRFLLEHAFFEATRHPAGYFVWSTDAGTPMLAADIVAEQRIDLFDMPHPPTPELRRQLVLLTVAMAFFEHASRS